MDKTRNIVKEKREELEKLEIKLEKLYDLKANEICPFKINDEIEYDQNKKGIVEKIYFPKAIIENLEDQEPSNWAVTGKKINKDGTIGKKEYSPISNKTHIVNGNACRKKTFDEIFGI